MESLASIYSRKLRQSLPEGDPLIGRVESRMTLQDKAIRSGKDSNVLMQEYLTGGEASVSQVDSVDGKNLALTPTSDRNPAVARFTCECGPSLAKICKECASVKGGFHYSPAVGLVGDLDKRFDINDWLSPEFVLYQEACVRMDEDKDLYEGLDNDMTISTAEISGLGTIMAGLADSDWDMDEIVSQMGDLVDLGKTAEKGKIESLETDLDSFAGSVLDEGEIEEDSEEHLPLMQESLGNFLSRSLGLELHEEGKEPVKKASLGEKISVKRKRGLWMKAKSALMHSKAKMKAERLTMDIIEKGAKRSALKIAQGIATRRLAGKGVKYKDIDSLALRVKIDDMVKNRLGRLVKMLTPKMVTLYRRIRLLKIQQAKGQDTSKAQEQVNKIVQSIARDRKSASGEVGGTAKSGESATK